MKYLLILVEQAYKKLALLFQPTYSYTFSDDLPEALDRYTIYILGEEPNPWAIAFECPCRCNSIIQLNLLKEANPRWEYNINSSRAITLKPSIWRKIDCKSHFFIIKGKIIWV